tara:strand:+ start:878 stop:1393 length:516 start_codon:yes stop_codon:yes gene_type:complete
MKILLKDCICASFLFSTLSGFTAEFEDPLQDLWLVGEAQLRVFFFRIYDSSIYTSSGSYEGVKPGLALKIEYRRAIDGDEFISRTGEEWEKLGLLSDESRKWLAKLEEFLPSVIRGDVIILKVGDNLESIFYYNSEWIGEVKNTQFTEDFLSIWLSEESSYPKLQQQLIGR